MRQTECIGSFAFMAPEVAKMNYDERADTWSIGVVLYMMLSKYTNNPRRNLITANFD